MKLGVNNNDLNKIDNDIQNPIKKNIEQIEKKNLINSRKIIEQNLKNLENINYPEKNKIIEDITISIKPNNNTENDPIIYLGKKREKENKEKEINPFLSKEEKNKDIYNINELKEDFEIIGNIVKSKNLDGSKHYFVFANDSKKIKKDSNGIYKVRFNILKENKWLALGFCDKKIVEDNKYEFASKNETNGCFIISTSSMIWHCMDRKQRKRITIPDTYPSLQSKNIKIECRYTPLESLVEFYVNDNYLISLKNVKPIKSDYLTPCVIFLKNSEVQTSYEYPI